MTKHLIIILKEMFRIIDVPFPKRESYFKKYGWYQKHTMTEKQHTEFEDWVVDYLASSREARKEFLEIETKNKKLIKKAVKLFMLSYSWKIKEEYLTINEFKVKSYYPWEHIKKVMGKREFKNFNKWMFGQGCYPEGVFPWDLERYLNKNNKIKNNN